MPELDRRYRIKDDLNGDVWENVFFDTWDEARTHCEAMNANARDKHVEGIGDPVLYEPVSVQTRERNDF